MSAAISAQSAPRSLLQRNPVHRVLVGILAAADALFLILTLLRGEIGGMIGEALILFLVQVLYFLPALIALRRNHRQRLPILILTLFAGWTFVGWVVAIVWACTADVEAW